MTCGMISHHVVLATYIYYIYIIYIYIYIYALKRDSENYLGRDWENDYWAEISQMGELTLID